MKNLFRAVVLGMALAASGMAAEAQVPISGLPAATLPLSGSEAVPVVQSGATKQAPVSAFRGSVSSVNVASTDSCLSVTGTPVTSTGTINLTVNCAPKWSTGRILTFNGDASGSGTLDGSVNLTIPLTLANSGVGAGTYTCPTVTVNSKGLLTNIISATCGSGSGGTPGGTNGQIQYNNSGAFGGFTVSGDFTINTSTGNGSLSNSGVTAGSCTNCNLTVNAKGIVTAQSNGSGGSGTVTATGSPASGNLTQFSGATSITNGNLSGDVTTSGTLAATIANNAVTTTKINNSAVTYTKIQNVSANSVLLGAGASGSGSPPSEIALGAGLSMSGTTLSATGGAFTLITETVTSGSAATVTFSSIPGTYRDLILRIRGRSQGAGSSNQQDVHVQFNGDTGGNYDYNYLVQDGGSQSHGPVYAGTSFALGGFPGDSATANMAGSQQYLIYDYRGTTFYKEIDVQVGGNWSTSGDSIRTSIFHGQWRSTSAITSILVFLSGGSFVDGSVVSLYGSL